MKMDIKKDVSTILLSRKDLSIERYILCPWERELCLPLLILWFVTCSASYAFHLLLHV